MEMKDWCINNLVQYMKRPIALTRNKEHAPASFCKESDDIRLLNPARIWLVNYWKNEKQVGGIFAWKQSTDTRCIDMGWAN